MLQISIPSPWKPCLSACCYVNDPLKCSSSPAGGCFRLYFPFEYSGRCSLPFAGGFHKPRDERFPVDLLTKGKLSIWTQCLLKFKVCGLFWALNSPLGCWLNYILKYTTGEKLIYSVSEPIFMSRKFLSNVILLSKYIIKFYFQYLTLWYCE